MTAETPSGSARDSAQSTELPAHIAALLQRQQRDEQGRPVDSAGIPWQGREFSGPGDPLHTFVGDDGLPAPALVTARDRLITGETDEAGFLGALRGLRLFVPVLATVAEHARAAVGADEDPVGDKQADISLISLESSDGRLTMPLFSSVEALTSWHSEARPVAAESERAALAALAEGVDSAVLDPGADLSFVIRRPALEALARGEKWTPSYQDPHLAQALEGILDHCPGVEQLVVRPSPGIATATAAGQPVAGGGLGPELRIEVVLQPGMDEVGARLAVATVQTSLGELEMLRERADSVQVTLRR